MTSGCCGMNFKFSGVFHDSIKLHSNFFLIADTTEFRILGSCLSASASIYNDHVIFVLSPRQPQDWCCRQGVPRCRDEDR